MFSYLQTSFQGVSYDVSSPLGLISVVIWLQFSCNVFLSFFFFYELFGWLVTNKTLVYTYRHLPLYPSESVMNKRIFFFFKIQKIQVTGINQEPYNQWITPFQIYILKITYSKIRTLIGYRSSSYSSSDQWTNISCIRTCPQSQFTLLLTDSPIRRKGLQFFMEKTPVKTGLFIGYWQWKTLSPVIHADSSLNPAQISRECTSFLSSPLPNVVIAVNALIHMFVQETRISVTWRLKSASVLCKRYPRFLQGFSVHHLRGCEEVLKYLQDVESPLYHGAVL